MLIRGVFGRSGSKASIVDRLHAIWPNLSAAELLDRMQEVARDGLPQWLRNEFWPEQVDRILLTGLERANRFRREAIAKALKACPALQVGAVAKRVRTLRTQSGRTKAACFAGTSVAGLSIVLDGGSAAADWPTATAR